jgi:hypothetical protein
MGWNLVRCLAVAVCLVTAGPGHVHAAAPRLPRLPTAGSLLPQPACLPPDQAPAHAGEQGCVEGTVTNAVYAERSNGQPTFLDFGPAFTAVIWGEDRAKFSPAPETLRGRRLRVSGRITTFRGKAQIVVRDPTQLGPAGVPSQAPAATTPGSTASPPASRTATPSPTVASTSPTTPSVTVATTPSMTTATVSSIIAATAAPDMIAVRYGTEDEAGRRWPLVVVAIGLIGVGAAGAAWYGLRRRG